MSGDRNARRRMQSPRGLPRGRASLPPEASAFLQRARILDATVRTVAEHGYADATVAKIQARAGVSRQTFYAAHARKQEAVIAAFSSAVAFGAPQLIAAYRGRVEWPAAIDAALTLYLRMLDCDRDWAALCLLGIEAAGERAIVRRERLLAPYVAAVASDEGERAALTGALAATHHRLRASVTAGSGSLQALRPELLDLLLGVRGARAGQGGVEVAGAPDVSVRMTRAATLRRLAKRGSDGLEAELARAIADRDGPALWAYVVDAEERRAMHRPVAEDARARALAALDGAWFFGLPIDRVAAGDPGPWLPMSTWMRCLVFLAACPDRTAAEVGAAVERTHHAAVYRLLNRLAEEGLVTRRKGPSRAAIWRCTAAGRRLLGHEGTAHEKF